MSEILMIYVIDVRIIHLELLEFFLWVYAQTHFFNIIKFQ